MNNYRVVDIYELADFIADETDEELISDLILNCIFVGFVAYRWIFAGFVGYYNISLDI